MKQVAMTEQNTTRRTVSKLGNNLEQWWASAHWFNSCIVINYSHRLINS